MPWSKRGSRPKAAKLALASTSVIVIAVVVAAVVVVVVVIAGVGSSSSLCFRFAIVSALLCSYERWGSGVLMAGGLGFPEV